ncbi:hypothetical protein RCXUPER_47 [Rhodobacter phage RcXuper]|nr:hypothetical protein RCXUPER_47 [Rhodobacter phage RcXuper]
MATLTYKSLSEVPEDLREHAKEGDSGFVVKVAPADKITEFRENNVKLSQQRDDLIAKVSQYEQVTGVPLEALETGKLSDFAKTLEALRETKKKVEDGALVENTSLEEAAAARVTEVTNSFKAQMAEIAKDRDAHRDRATKAEERANQMLVENNVRLAASDPDVAMLDKAVNLVLPQAFRVFRVEDGKLVPKTSDGTILYGSDGVTPMSMKEWLLKQRDENDFLFKGSRGGGASGSDQKTAGRLSAAELAAMTPQQRINYARKHGLV